MRDINTSSYCTIVGLVSIFIYLLFFFSPPPRSTTKFTTSIYNTYIKWSRKGRRRVRRKPTIVVGGRFSIKQTIIMGGRRNEKEKRKKG